MIFGTPPPQHLRGWGGVKPPAAARLPGWAQELVVVPIKVGKITIKVGALGRVADGCLQWASPTLGRSQGFSQDCSKFLQPFSQANSLQFGTALGQARL